MVLESFFVIHPTIIGIRSDMAQILPVSWKLISFSPRIQFLSVCERTLSRAGCSMFNWYIWSLIVCGNVTLEHQQIYQIPYCLHGWSQCVIIAKFCFLNLWYCIFYLPSVTALNRSLTWTAKIIYLALLIFFISLLFYLI